MNRCRDCRHAEREAWQPEEDNMLICRKISEDWRNVPFNEVQAITMADYGEESQLFVTPIFGCVLWEGQE
jgi:hypothetical protein